jgi:hypothetical protein
MVKRILTDEEQTQKQFLKKQQQLKQQEYKTKKINSLNIKLNKCDLPTLKKIYAYLIENKIMFFNDDIESGGDVVKFDMMELTNENIRILNKIIKDNFIIKVVKAPSLPDINYNNELILFDDD